MKKQLIAVTVAVCSTNIAYAETSGFYIGGQLGRSILKTETITTRNGDFQNVSVSHKARSAVSVLAGYNFNTEYDIPIRTDLSFTFRDNKEIKTGPELGKRIKIQANTLMFNTYYDIYTNSNFTPYVTLGAGASFIDIDADRLGEKYSAQRTKFAYSMGLGVSYKISEHWSADIMTKSTFTRKIRVMSKNAEGTKIETHDLMVGVLYTF